jgi:hypothetical protein
MIWLSRMREPWPCAVLVFTLASGCNASPSGSAASAASATSARATVSAVVSGAPNATSATKPEGPLIKCTASPSWVQSPSAPTKVEGDTPCAADQFSWQDFLYLVKPKGDEVEFESWKSSSELFPPKGVSPPPWSAEHTAKLPAGMKPGPGKTRRVLRLHPIVNVHHTMVTKSMLQAGSSSPLVDQNGRWVHYLEQVDQQEYDYIAQCDLYKTACFDTGGVNISLPEQSVELKSAWRVLETCDLPDSPKDCKPEDQKRYHTARAIIDPYGPGSKKPVLATVGLVGMHIVHKVPGHPELIWATFEHRDDAPDCDAKAATTDRSWIFNNPKCQGSNCADNVYCDPCSGKCGTSGDFDPSCAKPAIPTQVCRQIPITPVVAELNESVRAALPADSVWRNYMLVGTEYKAGGQKIGPDAGTIYLANLTMETYEQKAAVSTTPPTDSGCFNCHTAGFYPTTNHVQQADFSHIFRQSQQDGACGAGLPSFCPAPAPSASASSAPAASAKAAPSAGKPAR